MLKQDHVIKGVGDYNNKSRQSARFGVHKHCSSGDIMVLVCQVICNHVHNILRVFDG